MTNELIVMEQGIMPVMDINQALERRKQMVTFVQKIMVDGTDFGAIPGTGDKPTLLKPGAEKLATFFGLTKRFEIIERVEDWTGKEHGGEPFFYYLYRCQLWRGTLLIAEADGSCNSFEAKYRWRKGERVCPNCGQGSIIKGRAEYGGGWLCYARKGGCGAKFQAGDQAIEGQEVGRIPNPDICDQVNTLQKMSQKRALIAAVLLAVNASEFFTQDMEDFVDVPFEEVKPAQPKPDSRPVAPVRQEESKKPNGNGGNIDTLDKLFAEINKQTGNFYQTKGDLYKVMGAWPNFRDSDAVDAALSIALDHAKEMRPVETGDGGY